MKEWKVQNLKRLCKTQLLSVSELILGRIRKNVFLKFQSWNKWVKVKFFSHQWCSRQLRQNPRFQSHHIRVSMSTKYLGLSGIQYDFYNIYSCIPDIQWIPISDDNSTFKKAITNFCSETNSNAQKIYIMQNKQTDSSRGIHRRKIV